MSSVRKDSEKHPLRLIVLISQIGITMMVPIFFCAWLGYLVSEKTGMEILFVVFLILGIMAGFRSCYITIRKFVSLKSRSAEYNVSVRSVENSYKNHSLDQNIQNNQNVQKDKDAQNDPEDLIGERAEDPWDR